jgi:predicted DNA-binding transcriptional regulator AlpA
MTPRCLNRRQAAEYCGCGSLSTFDDWVRRGILPGPIAGTRRWDRKAIDVALDRASGLEAKSVESEYAKWKTARARHAEGRS